MTDIFLIKIGLYKKLIIMKNTIIRCEIQIIISDDYYNYFLRRCGYCFCTLTVIY